MSASAIHLERVTSSTVMEQEPRAFKRRPVDFSYALDEITLFSAVFRLWVWS